MQDPCKCVHCKLGKPCIYRQLRKLWHDLHKIPKAA